MGTKMKKLIIASVVIAVLIFNLGTTTIAVENSWPILEKATFVEYKGVEVDGKFHEGLVRVKKTVGKETWGQGYTKFIYKYGYMDKSGKLVVDCIYDYASNFCSGVSYVAIIGGKRGVIDKKGDFVGKAYTDYKGEGGTPESYHIENDIEYYNDNYKYGMRTYYDNKIRKFGTMDINGDTVIPFVFDEMRTFFEEKAIAEKDGKTVIIDTKGNILFEVPFDHFIEQGSIVEWGGDGESHYEYQPGFRSGMLVGYNAKGQMGAINDKGKIVVPFGKYDRMGDFSEGVCAVGNYKVKGERDLNSGYVNTAGKEIVPLKYDYTSAFSEGMGMFGVGKKAGFVNKEGKIVIQPKIYLEVNDFKDGLSLVRVYVTKYNGYFYGYMDKTGKMAIPARYHWADNMYSGYACVQDKDYHDSKYKEVIIDKTGKVVFGSIYAHALDGYIGEKVIDVGTGLIVLK